MMFIFKSWNDITAFIIQPPPWTVNTRGQYGQIFFSYFPLESLRTTHTKIGFQNIVSELNF